MTMITSDIPVDQVRVVRLENDHLVVEVSPETGGRITRLTHKGLGRDFLWRHSRLPLAHVEPGVAYDPNFTGGIDDIIPGDSPEVIDGLASPDHGELWSLALDSRVEGGALVLKGRLPVWGLDVRKRVTRGRRCRHSRKDGLFEGVGCANRHPSQGKGVPRGQPRFFLHDPLRRRVAVRFAIR